MDRPIRIVVADDHPVVRIGVRNMLTRVKALGGGRRRAMATRPLPRRLSCSRTSCSLMFPCPVAWPGSNACHHERAVNAKILLLTSTITTQQIIEALQIGARGIVLKDALASHLQTAIQTVYAGDYWIGGKRVVNLVSALHELIQQAAVPQRKTYGLTPRELEVVGCIVEGCSNRDIAKQFTLSEETVKRHLSNIFDKTGVSTRLELALFAIAHHLVATTP